MKKENKQLILAISGVKNSGKTTLITKLLPYLKKKNLNVAVIKHDGHEFEADIPQTDTWKFAQAGADGTLVFSKTKYMMIQYDINFSDEEYISKFPDADIIFLEGFKNSSYPKIEIVRKGNSSKSVCNQKGLLGIVTDFTKDELEMQSSLVIPKSEFFDLNDAGTLAKWIYQLWNKMQRSKE